MQDLRPLVDTDISWIVDELRELPGQSNVYRDVPDDVPYVTSYFQSMYSAGVLIGSVHGDSNSFILAAAMRPWYANRLEVHEMILWVPQTRRGSLVALDLVEHFTQAARQLEPHSIHVGASLDITSADKVLRMYERFGYVREGSGAVMRFNV
jgi:hypothetical protein